MCLKSYPSHGPTENTDSKLTNMREKTRWVSIFIISNLSRDSVVMKPAAIIVASGFHHLWWMMLEAAALFRMASFAVCFSVISSNSARGSVFNLPTIWRIFKPAIHFFLFKWANLDFGYLQRPLTDNLSR